MCSLFHLHWQFCCSPIPAHKQIKEDSWNMKHTDNYENKVAEDITDVEVHTIRGAVTIGAVSAITVFWYWGSLPAV